MKRTLIKELSALKGETVRVCGWVNSWRDHGKILFIDLRDRTGLLQVVFAGEEMYERAKEIRPEYVVAIEGIIKERPGKMQNEEIETGNVEMEAQKIEILNEAKTLPFDINESKEKIDEEKRLRYRYIDLRRQGMQKNFRARHKMLNFMRSFLTDEDFVEIETPVLTKSTPEGARDFIVPARLQSGKFYALPQSPQQYKQLLMVAGFEKYFQIVKCFRDEDPRADRQAEFTQLDIEMSFVTQEEIMDLIEKLFKEMVGKNFPEKKILKYPFPRITYKEAMEKYKTDRPDIRENKKDPDELAFTFVIDFPMFEWRKEENRWDAVHHPFTRPQTENIKEIKRSPKEVLACQYDLVLNGYEIGGGSLRSYKPEILQAIFEVMGHTKDSVKNKFGHLLEAFEYGAPPHGGIACGFDRFASIILNEPNIREVIAFPKTGDSRDLMMDAPNYVDEDQLEELNIKVIEQKKDE
jgi:aspartyl-tRNA synthetase